MRAKTPSASRSSTMARRFASANAGCEMQIRRHLDAGTIVRHPIELYAEAFEAAPGGVHPRDAQAQKSDRRPIP